MAWKTGRTLCSFYCTTCFQIVKVYFNTLSHFSNSEIFQVYHFKLRSNNNRLVKGKLNNYSTTLTNSFFDLKQRIKWDTYPIIHPLFPMRIIREEGTEGNTQRKKANDSYPSPSSVVVHPFSEGSYITNIRQESFSTS